MEVCGLLHKVDRCYWWKFGFMLFLINLDHVH